MKKPYQLSPSRLCLVLVTLSTFLISLVLIAPAPLSAQQGNDIRLSRVIDLLDEDEAVFGILSGDWSLNNARSLARSGLDFIIVDMEHGPWNPERLRIFLLGLTDRQRTVANGHLQMAVTPLVRVPQNGVEMMSFVVKQALDVGAFGIMFPMIENRAQALNAVSSMRYPRLLSSEIREPRGRRGRSPGNAAWFWGLGGGEYYERADVWPLNSGGDLLTIIQIETPRAVDRIEEIITTPGVGVIFLGPTDLSTQMGYGDNPGAPEVEEAIQTVLSACLRHDTPCAITTDAESVEERLREGFRMVTVGGDGGITAGTARALGLGRSAAGR
jgi:4-hydroxy-2-oxoheptanedioate aldolase